MSQNLALGQGGRVAFFSLEMSKEALVQRLLSSLSRVDGNRLRTGFLRENEWPRLTTAAGRLGDAEHAVDTLLNLRMQGCDGTANTESSGREEEVLHRRNDRRRGRCAFGRGTNENQHRDIANGFGKPHCRVVMPWQVLGSMKTCIPPFGPPGFMIQFA